MDKTTFNILLKYIVTGLLGSVLFWCPAWAQGEPTLAEVLVRAREAGLAEPVISQTLAMTYDAGIDRSAAARILVVLFEARQMEFDLEPFQSRIEEGIAKRIEGTRIATALEERLQRQVLVRERLQPGPDRAASTDQAAVVALADGLEMGLAPQDLDVLLQRAGDASLAMTAVAAEMWALLKQLDFDSALTDQIITEGLAQKALHPAWRNFPQIVVIARQKGVPDKETGAEALKGLQAGGEPADLLSRLGFTGRNLRTGPLGKD